MKREDFTFRPQLAGALGGSRPAGRGFQRALLSILRRCGRRILARDRFRYPDDIVEKFGTDIYAVKASAEYHGSATYDELIDIGCRVGRIGRSQCSSSSASGAAPSTSRAASFIYVNADLKTRKSAPWPEPIKRAILEFEHTRPAEANA